jgi:hypothetical protein
MPCLSFLEDSLVVYYLYCSTLFEDMTKLQQEYVQRVQDKVCQLEIVDGEGVRVLNSGSSSDGDGPVVIPTTEELAAYIREKATYGHIERVQTDALQRAEEKVAIAHQTYSLVDSTCKRLDNDLMELEKILQVRRTICLVGRSVGRLIAPFCEITFRAFLILLVLLAVHVHIHISTYILQNAGDFQAPGTAKPDDLAAIQVIPGSPDWILAKVINHNPQTGTYKLSDEDVESSKSKWRIAPFFEGGNLCVCVET